MFRNKLDPRLQFILVLVLLLGTFVLTLVSILVFAGQASLLVQVLLAAAALLCAVLLVATGYNIFARYRDGSGRHGELKATSSEEV